MRTLTPVCLLSAALLGGCYYYPAYTTYPAGYYAGSPASTPVYSTSNGAVGTYDSSASGAPYAPPPSPPAGAPPAPPVYGTTVAPRAAAPAPVVVQAPVVYSAPPVYSYAPFASYPAYPYGWGYGAWPFGVGLSIGYASGYYGGGGWYGRPAYRGGYGYYGRPVHGVPLVRPVPYARGYYRR